LRGPHRRRTAAVLLHDDEGAEAVNDEDIRQTASRATFVASVRELPIAQIEVNDDRLRPVSATAVAAFADSIREHGLIYPVTVRRLPKARFELVDGGHRLAALVELGHEVVEVRCYEGPAPAIRLIEIDTNLARADLSDLDRAIHMAARRREYLAEHPETAQGIAGAVARWDATAELAVASFVSMTVAQTGLPERKVRKLVEAGGALDAAMKARLRDAKTHVTLNDLLVLAKADPDKRPGAVEAFASGKVRKIAQAFKPAPKPKDPVETSVNALLQAWDRAGDVARRRFLEQREAAVMSRLQKVRDAKVINLRLGKTEGDEAGPAILDAMARRMSGAAE